MIRADRLKLTGLLLLLAFAVGIVISVGDHVIFALALGRSVDLDETDVLALNAALTAVPFLYLAFRPRLWLWLLALAATAAFHGWWLTDGIAYQMARRGGGVPILGAVVMLFSPFAILLLTGVLDVATSRRGNGSKPLDSGTGGIPPDVRFEADDRGG